MLKCKSVTYLVFSITLLIFSACFPPRFDFYFKKDHEAFLKTIPAVSQKLKTKYNKGIAIEKLSRIDAYKIRYQEKYIENGNVVEIAQVKVTDDLLNNSNDLNIVKYLKTERNHQELWLVKLNDSLGCTDESKNSHYLLFAAKYIVNPKKSDFVYICVGFGPSYLGECTFDKQLGKRILKVYAELKVKRDKNKNTFDLCIKNPHTSIYFIFNEFDPCNILNVEEVVILDTNKIGGKRPMFFNIKETMNDSTGLQFKYEKTFKLK